jgi:hypothetical protein
MNLSNILPPTSAQLRETEKTISIAEKAIKELMHAYFKLFLKSSGPRYKKYRHTAENVRDFEDLPGNFADKQSIYYMPNEYGSVEEEIMVSETKNEETGDIVRKWEMWELHPVTVPADSVWDADGRIAALSDSERMRINMAVGELMRLIQVSWVVIANRCNETQGMFLDVCPENITLKLIDTSRASKSDLLDLRIGVDITIKDKIEINN